MRHRAPSRPGAGRLAPPALTALMLLGGACGGGELHAVAVLPETGHLAPYGKEIRKGMELARRDVEAPDGTLGELGKAMQLVFVDDGSSPERAEQEVRKAMETRPFAVLGPVHGEVVLGSVAPDGELNVVEMAGESGQVLLSPWLSVPTADRGYRNLFRNYPSDEIEAGRLAKLLRRDLTPRVKDVVVITELTDYGRGFKAAFGQAFKRLQGNVETSKYYERDLRAPDAAALVEELRVKPAGGCLLIATGADYAILLKALRDIDYREPIFATGSFHGAEIAALAGEAAQGVVYVGLDFRSDSNSGRAFAAAYRDEHGSAPTVWAALGYESVVTLAEAVRVMKGVYRADLHGLLRSLSFEAPGVIADKVRFDTTGECSECPLGVFGLRDGTALPWSAYEEYWNQSRGGSS